MEIHNLNDSVNATKGRKSGPERDRSHVIVTYGRAFEQ